MQFWFETILFAHVRLPAARRPRSKKMAKKQNAGWDTKLCEKMYENKIVHSQKFCKCGSERWKEFLAMKIISDRQHKSAVRITTEQKVHQKIAIIKNITLTGYLGRKMTEAALRFSSQKTTHNGVLV